MDVFLRKSFFSNVMLVTYLVEVVLISVEHSIPSEIHDKIMLGFMVLILGKFVDISVTLAKLEREHSPWQKEQEFVESHPEFAGWIRSVVENVRLAESFSNATYQEHLKDDLKEFDRRMDGYGRGYIENLYDHPPVFFYRYPDDFIRDTTQRMLATCIVERGTFWESGSSLSMLERQGQLKKSGIDVMRIFIQCKNRLSELQEVIQLHNKYDVPVRIAIVDDTKNPLPEHLQNDFMVVDHDVLIRQEMRNDRFTSTKVWLGQAPNGEREIEKALRDFESLRRDYTLPPDEAFKRAGISFSTSASKDNS